MANLKITPTKTTYYEGEYIVFQIESDILPPENLSIRYKITDSTGNIPFAGYNAWNGEPAQRFMDFYKPGTLDRYFTLENGTATLALRTSTDNIFDKNEQITLTTEASDFSILGPEFSGLNYPAVSSTVSYSDFVYTPISIIPEQDTYYETDRVVFKVEMPEIRAPNWGSFLADEGANGITFVVSGTVTPDDFDTSGLKEGDGYELDLSFRSDPNGDWNKKYEIVPGLQTTYSLTNSDGSHGGTAIGLLDDFAKGFLWDYTGVLYYGQWDYYSPVDSNRSMLSGQGRIGEIAYPFFEDNDTSPFAQENIEWYGSYPFIRDDGIVDTDQMTVSLYIVTGGGFGPTTAPVTFTPIPGASATVTIEDISKKSAAANTTTTSTTDTSTLTSTSTTTDTLQFTANTSNETFTATTTKTKLSIAKNKSDYTIEKVGSAWQISGSDIGTDTLSGFKRLEFSDGTLAIDIDAGDTAGQAYRLYQAAFARTPDMPGVAYHMNDMEGNGLALENVANNFIASPEFKTKYGENPSDDVFIDLLYQNVLGRSADADGLAFYTNHFTAGTMTRAAALIGFAESPENVSLVAPQIEDGIWLAS